MRNALIVAVLAVSITSCAGLGANNREIFEHPEKFVGQEVRICGYIRDGFESRNIWVSRWDYKHAGLGLGFISDQVPPGSYEGPLHEKTTCIQATIVRTGCAKEKICFGMEFDYAARLVKPQ